MKLLVATSNAGKLREIREILADAGMALVSLADLGMAAAEEPFETFQENAAHKAREAGRASGLWALGDDSGLCVDALDGAPGVYSARYAPTEEKRRAKLLRALAAVPAERRGAHFLCAAALSSPDGCRLVIEEGRVVGRVVFAPRGSNGFGYDPLFEPEETPGRTLAELDSADKNRLSHRGRALLRLRPVLLELARRGSA